MASSQQLILGQVPATGGGGAYQISRSLRFNSADSAYLDRTPASAGNRKTWTWSGWAKRSALLASGEHALFIVGTALAEGTYFQISFTDNAVSCGTGSAELRKTTALYRDVSAWYHVIVAVDTTQATAGNRVKIYVNGVEVTVFSTNNNPTLNLDTAVNSTLSHNIGRNTFNSSNFFPGYLTEINFIDGQALTPSDFGQTNSTTGVWEPIAYTGTYGTNGFYLNFSDNASTTTLGDDLSGNGNDWTTNNFSVTAGAGNDSLVDTPTPYGTDTGAGGEVRGNYCTANPLNQTSMTFSNGNLNIVGGSNSVWGGCSATLGMSSGKWYWEITENGGNTHFAGLATALYRGTVHPGADANSWGYYSNDGNKVHNNVQTAYGASWTTLGDVIGTAFDADAGTLTFYKNGVSQGTAFTGLTSGPYLPAFGLYETSSGLSLNFGQRPFSYTAPSGFKALVTTNLLTPTVVQGDDYFNTILYTGTGSSNARTGVGFQPDFVWIKGRSGATDHGLYDAVRGVQQQLESNTTTDETTESTGLTAFGTDGFTVGALAQLNTSAATYVAWCWKESTTSAFDIVTYTGNGSARTISHNLGVVPNMIIVKARTTASTDQGWPVYHSANTAAPETDYLMLNTTAATADLDTVWNDTAPTSSVFSVGTNALVNANNDTYVAYLFANVPGYSAFGSYTGNGSTDGPFVFTGFRPAWILIKNSTGVYEWSLTDSKRSPFNLATEELCPNNANAENGTSDPADMDILSNGFKLRLADGGSNQNGATLIYAAFAENPFKYSLAR